MPAGARTRALNAYLDLHRTATPADPEYQRLWQDRIAAEQPYRTSLVAVLARRELPDALTAESVASAVV